MYIGYKILFKIWKLGIKNINSLSQSNFPIPIRIACPFPSFTSSPRNNSYFEKILNVLKNKHSRAQLFLFQIIIIIFCRLFKYFPEINILLILIHVYYYTAARHSVEQLRAPLISQFALLHVKSIRINKTNCVCSENIQYDF